MKSLKPSHRERKRYLLINGKDATKSNVESSMLEFIGILGYATASPQIIQSKPLVIAINRESLDKVRTSFLLSGKDIHITKVSGSVSKVKTISKS